MAGKDNSKKDKKDKLGFVERVKNFFLGIISELKRVVWPNEKTYKQAIGAVFTITIISALIIFVVDQFMQVVLDLAGFNRPQKVYSQQVNQESTQTSSVKVEEPQPTASAEASTTK